MALRDKNLPEKELTGRIIRCFFVVYDALGFGFLESVYRRAMSLEFAANGIDARCEIPIDVCFRKEKIGHFRADFIVEQKVIIEIKASHTLVDADRKQLLNYSRATQMDVGLLLHFGPKA
jgi:GxxExxY protein